MNEGLVPQVPKCVGSNGPRVQIWLQVDGVDVWVSGLTFEFRWRSPYLKAHPNLAGKNTSLESQEASWTTAPLTTTARDCNPSSDGLQPTRNLQPSRNGLQPTSDGLQPSIVMVSDLV